jgi:hypothetical protein
MALHTECFITNVAAKWPLTAMYEQMFLQFPLLSKPLFTEVAAILAIGLNVSESAL